MDRMNHIYLEELFIYEHQCPYLVNLKLFIGPQCLYSVQLQSDTHIYNVCASPA